MFASSHGRRTWLERPRRRQPVGTGALHSGVSQAAPNAPKALAKTPQDWRPKAVPAGAEGDFDPVRPLTHLNLVLIALRGEIAFYGLRSRKISVVRYPFAFILHRGEEGDDPERNALPGDDKNHRRHRPVDAPQPSDVLR